MSKVMLVEDDNNLREIYEARLQAEGYAIVTAHDGEEALAVAKTEMPDLIISDVMMPKISGFEMLDILRNTDGLKDVKVIMLTALGQSDDQQRADRLGADSYLVKSQVTLEDIVKVAGRLLGNEEEPAPEVTPLEPVAPVVIEAPVAPEPVVVTAPPPAPALQPLPAPVPVAAPVAAIPEPVAVPEPVITAAVAEPLTPVAPIAFGAPVPTVALATSPVVTQPPAIAADTDFLQSLGASSEATPMPAAQPVAEEAATVEAQIASFEKATSPAPEQVEPTAMSGPETTENFVTTAPPDLTTTAAPTEPTTQSAGNDDVLADALQTLTGQAPAAINVTAVPPVAETAPSVDPTVARGGNRVLTPLDTPDKPDIHMLLALEEAKETATVAPAVVAPAPVEAPAPPTVQPVTVAPTTPVGATPPAPVAPVASTEQPFDPNNIAL